MGKNQFMMGFVMANLRGGENHQNYTVGGSKPLFKVSALYWSTTPPTQKCAEFKRLHFMQFIKVLIFLTYFLVIELVFRNRKLLSAPIIDCTGYKGQPSGQIDQLWNKNDFYFYGLHLLVKTLLPAFFVSMGQAYHVTLLGFVENPKWCQ